MTQKRGGRRRTDRGRTPPSPGASASAMRQEEGVTALRWWPRVRGGGGLLTATCPACPCGNGVGGASRDECHLHAANYRRPNSRAVGARQIRLSPHLAQSTEMAGWCRLSYKNLTRSASIRTIWLPSQISLAGDCYPLHPTPVGCRCGLKMDVRTHFPCRPRDRGKAKLSDRPLVPPRYIRRVSLE
jgi:hypothetical protein